MLRVSLSALAEGAIETTVVVSPADPLLEDLEVSLKEPLTVRGRLTDSGPGRYYWKGMLETRVATSCRRCLGELVVPVVATVEALFTEEDSADDPATYQIAQGAVELVLDEMVREELLLAVPAYPLCREDCRGLCAQCGKELNEGPCTCEQKPDQRWAALQKLTDRGPQEES